MMLGRHVDKKRNTLGVGSFVLALCIACSAFWPCTALAVEAESPNTVSHEAIEATGSVEADDSVNDKVSDQSETAGLSVALDQQQMLIGAQDDDTAEAENSGTLIYSTESSADDSDSGESELINTRPKVESTLSGSSCVLSWNDIPGATGYAVAKRTDSGWYTYTYQCTSTRFELSQLESGREYQFLVQAYVDGEWSPFDDSDAVRVRYDIPHPEVSYNLSGSSCRLSWDSVPYASRYAVAKWTGNGWYTYTLNCAGTHFDLSDLETGIEYRFLVQANVDGQWSAFGDDDVVAVTYTDPTVPANVRATPSGDGEVTLSWDSVAGADRYAVAELTNAGWKTFTYDCTDTSFTAADLVNGRTHRFLVQAYVDGAWSPCLERLCVEAIPTGTTKPAVSVKTTGDSALDIVWGKVPGATRYAIAMGVGSTWKTYTYNFTGTSFSLTGLTPGQPYRFLVQAYVDGSWTSFDEDDVTIARPSGTIPYVGQPRVAAWRSGSTIHLTWDGIADADRYVLYEVTGDSALAYTKIADIAASGQEILSYDLSDLQGCDYTYTLFVQAFRNDQGSSFSSTDFVKVYIPGWQHVADANSGELKLRQAAFDQPATPAGYCAAWVENVYQRAGLGYYNGNANDLYYSYCKYSDPMDLKVGMIVAVSSHTHSTMGRIYGHVGIYIGDGYLRDSVYGRVRQITMREWLDYYSTTVTPKWGWLGNRSQE